MGKSVTAVPTLAQVRDWPATVDVTTAAKALGISRSKYYELVRLNQAPAKTLPLGGVTRVITASLIRVLEGGDPADERVPRSS
ncbi:DNA-binding protein [Streptomyces sp. NPDC052207]|uniref:DNA-binding protein n=1 Tax=Streptomyces sp. NPDC052207 TaxID=3155418 RepID=UPI0034138062